MLLVATGRESEMHLRHPLVRMGGYFRMYFRKTAADSQTAKEQWRQATSAGKLNDHPSWEEYGLFACPKDAATPRRANVLFFVLRPPLVFVPPRHRDIKPENLILASPSDLTSIRLADFGSAASVRDGQLTTISGTPGYVAPEVLRSIPYGTVRGGGGEREKTKQTGSISLFRRVQPTDGCIEACGAQEYRF